MIEQLDFVFIFQIHVDQVDPDPQLAQHFLQCEFQPALQLEY